MLNRLADDLASGNGHILESFLDNHGRRGVALYDDYFFVGTRFPINELNHLQSCLEINSHARRHILRLGHGPPLSGSTINSFINDTYNPQFLSFLNDIENLPTVRAMVGHKPGVNITNAELDEAFEVVGQLATDIASDAIIKQWVERSQRIGQMQNRFQLGNQFEQSFIDAIRRSTPSSQTPEYQSLRSAIPDIEERTIMTNVQLCLQSQACNSSGNYFIPDLVAIKRVVDPGTGEIVYDIAIIDCKLTNVAPWTTNQKRAATINSYKVKSVGDQSDIIQPLNNPTTNRLTNDEYNTIVRGNKPLQRNQHFVKATSDGNGNFSNVTTVANVQ